MWMSLLLLAVLSTCSATWSGVLINWGKGTQIWEPTTAAQTDVHFNITPYFSETAIKMGGKAYFLGGSDEEGWHSDVFIFDPVTNVTADGPSLTNWYTAFGIIAGVINSMSDEAILVCGMIQSGYNACEKYSGGKWSPVSAPPRVGSYDKADSIMVVHDGEAYIIGGFVDSAVFVYNATSDTWATKSPAPTPLSSHRGISISDNTILVCGGTNFTLPANYSGIIPNDAQCMTYSTNEDMWTILPKSKWLNSPRAYFKMIKYAGRIYVLGGENMWDYLLSSVELYDRATGTWQRLPNPLPFQEGDFAAVPIVNSK